MTESTAQTNVDSPEPIDALQKTVEPSINAPENSSAVINSNNTDQVEGGVAMSGNTSVGGDVVGHDKITNVTNIVNNLTAIQNSSPSKELLQNHIEPLYRDSQQVIADYREILLDIQDKLQNDEPIANIIFALKKRRIQFAQNRQEILLYAQLLQNQPPAVQPEPTKIFAHAVFELLTKAEPTTPRSSPFMTMASSLIDDFQQLQQTNQPREHYLALLDPLSRDIDAHSAAVDSSYVQLRYLCLQ